MPVTQTSPASEKIALFRSLFRGREEVYPRRFESAKSGRAGYSPVCGNEWVRGVCEKPRIRCGDCPHQRWLPVTDDVVRCHLSGVDDRGRDFVAGVYPMLLDERCFLLAVDFDKGDWNADALAYLESCERFQIPAVLERSRSGNGGHVWIFFAEAIAASLARKLGSHVLTETMERRPEVGLKSYDRFFPNQDTLPRGGFGNLIALPLQKAARENDNSVFVDAKLAPYQDQWAFLAGVQRMPKQHIETIVREAEGRNRVVGVRMALPEDEDDAQPWKLTPSRRRELAPTGVMPKALALVLSDQLYVPKAALPPSLHNALVRLAAFQNPEFYKAQAMRLPTFDKPRIIACAEEHTEHIALPRGCLDDTQNLLRALKIKTNIRDERFAGQKLEMQFTGALRADQQKAGEAMLAHDFGVLAATTAFGKTVIAAWLIAQRGVNTLVLVHRQQLMEQWVERLSQFLGIGIKAIGRWGGGRKKLTGRVDVALIQSLVRKDVVNDLVAGYGHLVVDECHHLSARSFELVARRAKAVFVTGLSATVARKDGHHPIIFMQCGPVRYRVDARAQAAERPFTHEVLVRPTGFIPAGAADEDKRVEFQRLCAAVVHSTSRNRLIVAEIVQAVKAGRSPVVLTERTEHVEMLALAMRQHVAHVIALQGGMGRKPFAAALERLKSIPGSEGRVIVATGRFVGEGFDDRGRMEVDLLCEATKIVIEIDGMQHLGDAAAYRRDRRKDALLQAHGYFVLRFLADDLGKHLDGILDTVLRTLASRSRQTQRLIHLHP